MSLPRHVLLTSLTFAFILIVGTLQGADGTHFEVVNNIPESKKQEYFNPLRGTEEEKRKMKLVEGFIRQSFDQRTPYDRKPMSKITLSVNCTMTEASANTVDGKEAKIHLSASQLKKEFVDHGDDAARRMFKELLLYEMTRVLQWTGTADDADSKALTDGIAAFMVLKKGYEPRGWVGEGEGKSWKERKDVTARFLQYCEALYIGFVAELNRRLRQPYTAATFSDSLDGFTIDEMWERYRKKHKVKREEEGD